MSRAREGVVTTPGRIPEEFIYAEIASFPLVAEAAFRQGVCALDARVGKDEITRALWRACEAHIAEHSSWSLDRIVSTRDHLWFDQTDHRVSMTRYLERLARLHFEPSPGVTRLTSDDQTSVLQVANRVRWLSFAMPEDLLLCALGVEPAPTHVEPDTPLMIRRLLDLGVAEIHQHLGASMEFPLLWVSVLDTLATTGVREDALAGPGAPFDEGRTMIRWLQVAAVTRCVLAEFLARRQEGRASGSLRAFLDEVDRDEGDRDEGDRDEGDRDKLDRDKLDRDKLDRTPVSLSQRLVLLQAMLALESGDDDQLPDFRDLRELYFDLHPTADDPSTEPLHSVEDAYRRCDPICVRMGLGGRNAGERWLMREALAYLRAHEAKPSSRDRLFERLWWQLVRIRCQFYRAIVERPMNSGLQWFIRTYDRIGQLRAPLQPILVEASYRAAGRGARIAALEVRTSMSSSPFTLAEDKLLPALLSWRQVLSEFGRQDSAPEFGLVLHFVKARDFRPSRAWSSGSPRAFWAQTHAEPRKLGSHKQPRYLEFFASQASKARALAELLEAVPSMLWLVRGLDIAADELAAPCWVFVPLFAYLREAADVASAKISPSPPTLGATAHVGEDFRHLMEGMRRIYEQVHYLLGRRGGRLGHAIALGVEPRLWAESAGVVSVPIEQRLWDLVFEWRLYTRYHTTDGFGAEAPAGRIELLQNQIQELSTEVYEAALEPRTLADLHHDLHTFLLPRPGRDARLLDGGLGAFERGWHRIPDPNRRALLIRYLRDPEIFNRGQRLIDVRASGHEIEALAAIQAGLRRGIAQRSVVVEVNPSSNLLIGDLGDLRHHPLLRLFPPEPDDDGPPPIAIAIGSDDPVTFSTSLVQEYVLLHQTGRAAGYSERSVQLWLDAIRRTGLDARMTRPWRPSAKDKTKSLIKDLHRYLDLPEHLMRELRGEGRECSPNTRGF